MAGLERRGEHAQNRRKHSHNLPKVGRKEENDGLLDIFVDSAPFLDGFFYGGKIIVCENDVCCLLCHVRTAFSHCNPHIGRF